MQSQKKFTGAGTTAIFRADPAGAWETEIQAGMREVVSVSSKPELRKHSIWGFEQLRGNQCSKQVAQGRIGEK